MWRTFPLLLDASRYQAGQLGGVVAREVALVQALELLAVQALAGVHGTLALKDIVIRRLEASCVLHQLIKSELISSTNSRVKLLTGCIHL